MNNRTKMIENFNGSDDSHILVKLGCHYKGVNISNSAI